MSRNISIGIDLGTYSTNTVVLEFDQKNNAPKILALSSSPSSGLRQGAVVDVKEAAESIKSSIKSAQKTAGFPLRRAFVSIGGAALCSTISKGVSAVSRADGEITESDIKRAVINSESILPKMANKNIIHSIPLFFKIDNESAGRNPVGMKGGKLEVETLFITAPSQNFNNILKSFEMAGIKVKEIIAGPLAAGRVLLQKKQKEVGSLLMDIGGGTVSFAIFEKGLPAHLNILPFGGDNITNDIATLTKIPLDEAEKLKHLCGAENSGIDKQTQKKLSEIIDARLRDAFDLANENLKKINRERLLPGGAILTGGSANFPMLANLAKDCLQLNAELGLCYEFETKENKFFDAKWATALGLAMLDLDDDDELNGSGISVINPILQWLKNFLP